MPVLLVGSPDQRDKTNKAVWTKVQTACTPNELVSSRMAWVIIAGWVAFFLAYWNTFKPDVFPSPLDVVYAFPNLWFRDGLGQEVISSFMVNLQALALSAAISLPLAYLSRTPIMRPLAVGVAKLRFISPAVFFLVLLFLASTGHEVKVYMLALGETFFLVTTMVGVVEAIPEYAFDDARTLRMSEWKSLWYVVIRGTIPATIDAIRDNAAMGWSMLTFVEGIVRSEGGVGVLLLNNEKHVNFASLYAIVFVILAVGIGQDAVIGWVRKIVCPYAR